MGSGGQTNNLFVALPTDIWQLMMDKITWQKFLHHLWTTDDNDKDLTYSVINLEICGFLYTISYEDESYYQDLFTLLPFGYIGCFIECSNNKMTV